MRVPFEWIKEFVDISASPEEVADRLTMVGLEVEGTDTVNSDTIFEVNVTPNRPDCLSIVGIAREVAAAFSVPLKIPGTSIPGDLPLSDIEVDIADPELCNRYAGRSVKGIRVSDSPPWMKDRLEKCGIRALNNIVDITNYVLLEMGHPLHAFDADRLSGGKIRVATAGTVGTIVTLDEEERKLSEESLLIWDAKTPVAIAGVMGGGGSSVTLDTKNIFLESAYFSPLSIRRTAKNLGLSTESSYRFERGTDIQFLENALNRAALLVQEIAGGTIHEIVDPYPVKFVPDVIEVDFSRVNTLLGTDLHKDEILRQLESIGIQTEDKGSVFLATPPAFRRDIQEYVDIVEEVARCYNYGNIPVTVPRSILADGIVNSKELRTADIRETLRKSGFNEVVNYSFMNSADIDLLSLPGDDIRRRYMEVRNPLRQEESLMRTTLIPSLINNFLYNLSRGMRDIRFFESSRIFLDTGEQLPEEKLRLGGIYYQDNTPMIWRDTVSPFYIVKGAIQTLLDELKISDYSFNPSCEVFLHSGKSADIRYADKTIGFIGELGPHVVDRFNLKIKKPEIVVFEIDLDILLSLIPETITYAQIPKYPAIERDIALIVDEGITSAEVMETIRGYKSEIIERIELFDFYKGKNIPQQKKSLGYRIIYRSPDRTLTDQEVETFHHGLIEHILDKTGGEIRK
jgi:phenylalanyl-tRNA synthetase beta chain